MNIYTLFVNGFSPFYVKAGTSDRAIAILGEHFPGVRVSAWDIARSLPRWATILEAK